MAVYTSVAALEAGIMKALVGGMTGAASTAEGDLYEASGGYYTGGDPVKYMRTGLLANSPEVSGLEVSGKTCSFEAKFDTSTPYSTGTWDTDTVFDAANNGALVGSGGFREKGFEAVKNTTRSSVASALGL